MLLSSGLKKHNMTGNKLQYAKHGGKRTTSSCSVFKTALHLVMSAHESILTWYWILGFEHLRLSYDLRKR